MDGENNGKPLLKWRIRGYVPQFSDIFGNTHFGNITIEKHILKQRWPQNGPGENRHQKRTQSFYLKMENDKFRTSVNMFFFANMKNMSGMIWYEMWHQWYSHAMMGTFWFQPPVFGMFFDETSLFSWRRSRLSRQSRIVWDRPWRSWGLGWCAAYPGRQRFENGVSRSSTVNLTDTYVFKEIRPLP